MRLSYNWLKEFVQFDATPTELAEKLTLVGLEISGVHHLAAGLEAVVVGLVQSVAKHPNSDHLSLCQVTTATQTYRVVCGAANVRANLKTAFIPAGYNLPDGTAIKAAKIRGEVSEGMLCSERELGLSHEHAGIMELPDSCEVGQQLVIALGLDDYALEAELTTNRSDGLCHLGIAREIAAIFDLPLKLPDTSVNEAATPVDTLAKVTIKNETACPRYAARVIQDVKVGPSPLWLQQRLRAVGQRPINNVVDITNFVLMELGHPLHAFDYDQIGGHHIIVRSANKDETFTTLDGNSHTLDVRTLLIADEKGGVAVGGIMGGLHSEVTAQTTQILLESAYFNPQTIRFGAKKIGMRTEASNRFEKGTDPENVLRALNRAARLIADITGGRVAGGVIDNYPKPLAPLKTSLRLNQVSRILGIAIDPEKIYRILTRLGFTILRDSTEIWPIIIPTYRRDVEREIDLIEEIARHYGYANIPDRLNVAAATSVANDAETITALIRQVLTGAGYTEFVTTSFVDESSLKKMPYLGIDSTMSALVRIKNPLTAEYNCLRPNLLTTVLPQIRHNIYQKNLNLKVFELSRTFAYDSIQKPVETIRLGLFITGMSHSCDWAISARAANFFDLKGALEDLFTILKLSNVTYNPIQNAEYHPARAAEVFLGAESVGTLGELSTSVKNAFDIPTPAYWAELDVMPILALTASVNKKYKRLPRYPMVTRDLALVVDTVTASQPILDQIFSAAGPYLENAQLFDIFQGGSLPADKKSLAFALTFRSNERTLADSDIDPIIRSILVVLEREFKATLRT